MPKLTTEGPTRVRFVVLAALAAGAILSYLLRVCISPAGTTIQGDIGISDVAMGDVYSAFFLGYFWFQIPAGLVGNRFGARISLAVMGLLWAFATVVSARSHSTALLYWSRVALGVAQAGLFPVTIMAIRDWYPRERHGFASSVITACMSAGAVLASALTTRLLGVFGWRETFLIYGLIGAAWALWFLAWFRDTPDRHPAVNALELDLIRGSKLLTATDPESSPIKKTPGLSIGQAMFAMLGSAGMWALCTQAFFQAFGYAIFTTWFPAYLEKGRGVSVKAAGDLTTLPLFTIVIGSLVGGYLIDLILKKTGSRWLSRSGLPAAGMALCASLAFAATLITSPLFAVSLIAIGMFFAGIAMPGKWACSIDLTGAHSATGFAVMNMAGNIGAWVCPKVVGQMFQGLDQGKGDWNSVLWLLAGIQMAAAIGCFVLNPNKPAIRTHA